MRIGEHLNRQVFISNKPELLDKYSLEAFKNTRKFASQVQEFLQKLKETVNDPRRINSEINNFLLHETVKSLVGLQQDSHISLRQRLIRLHFLVASISEHLGLGIHFRPGKGLKLTFADLYRQSFNKIISNLQLLEYDPESVDFKSIDNALMMAKLSINLSRISRKFNFMGMPSNRALMDRIEADSSIADTSLNLWNNAILALEDEVEEIRGFN